MELTTRPWITAGLAAVAVTAALPAATALPDVPAISTGAVKLAGSEDIGWDQVLQTALANAADIDNHLFPAVLADVQQFAANIPEYLDGTRHFGADLTTAYDAAISPFTPVDAEPYIYSSLDSTTNSVSIDSLLGHLFDLPLLGKTGLLDILGNGLTVVDVNIPVLSEIVGSAEAAKITPYLEFSGSPLSGILWGDLGTTLSPLLQLHDDIAGITAALEGTTPDYTTAVNDLLNMPANLSNAFLNGYGDISLNTLLIDLGIVSPTTGADFNADLGGLLSAAGSVIEGIGVSDTVGDCSVVCATFDVPSNPVGPIASLFEQDQAIAEAIGWDGVGQPLAHLFSELTALV